MDLPDWREQLKAEADARVRDAQLYRDVLDIPEALEEIRKYGHKVLFVNFAQKRLLAVVDESGQRWVVPPDTVSKEEQNGLLKWMGKLREYIMARKDRETILVPVEGDFKGPEARFLRIGKFLAERAKP